MKDKAIDAVAGIFWVVGLLLCGSTAVDDVTQIGIGAVGLAIFFIVTIVLFNDTKD